ncbi:cob(I)yrinic acid a,c-diamide adenosyltransferase [Spiroplasma endosymbiont of Glossina fuscipes fuscipes]|uniref:cob(I)yrinic acid a,c-diamide adenosyltransferase n=1 Tax=Spiroplasma endosymbiont of Glossina fuscipes fuscipes TaxID=2004463 RepID=UPI003C783765
MYYGDGKGKTSILNGMTIRALGYQWKVKYLRFFKKSYFWWNVIFSKISWP